MKKSSPKKKNNVRGKFLIKIGIIIAVVAVVIVALWFFVLSNGDIESGIVGHWDFNEGTGSILGDSSDYGNDGTIHGATWVTGIEGQALELDGINDYINVGNDYSLNPIDEITISTWFKPVSYVGYGNDPIVTKGFTSHIDPYYQYHLGISGDLRPSGTPGSFSFYVTIGGIMHHITTPAGTWTAGNWYHIVGTYDGSKLSIYVNGAIQGATTISTLILEDYGQDVQFGKFNNLIGHAQNIEGYLPGTIDEVHIYERSLSAQEVESLYLSIFES